MTSSKHNGTVYTIRKLDNGQFSACAFIAGVKVVVVNELRRIAVASIKAHIDDAE
jgi:DNA-directed RNA polymerase alpha subunit